MKRVLDLIGYALYNLFERFQLVRRFSLAWTLVLTHETYRWAFTFAAANAADGVGTAAILGAILGPLSVLQGYVFGQYVKGTTEREDYVRNLGVAAEGSDSPGPYSRARLDDGRADPQRGRDLRPPIRPDRREGRGRRPEGGER
jgi:hypothetical protein